MPEQYVTSEFLQRKFEAFLRRRDFDFIFHNKFIFGKIESDIIACKGGLMHEFELKISESDFRRDSKKKRHQHSTPNYFYYVVSDLSIINGDFLKYAGIYYHKFQSDGASMFVEHKKPSFIRASPIENAEMYDLLKKIYKTKRKNG